MYSAPAWFQGSWAEAPEHDKQEKEMRVKQIFSCQHTVKIHLHRKATSAERKQNAFLYVNTWELLNWSWNLYFEY